MIVILIRDRYHAIAINHDTLCNYREAMNYERKNYTILSKVLPDARDARIVEADTLMREFLMKALEFEKTQKMNNEVVT